MTKAMTTKPFISETTHGPCPPNSACARAAIERVRLVINPHPRKRGAAWNTPKSVPDRAKPTRDAGEVAT